MVARGIGAYLCWALPGSAPRAPSQDGFRGHGPGQLPCPGPCHGDGPLLLVVVRLSSDFFLKPAPEHLPSAELWVCLLAGPWCCFGGFRGVFLWVQCGRACAQGITRVTQMRGVALCGLCCFWQRYSACVLPALLNYLMKEERLCLAAQCPCFLLFCELSRSAEAPFQIRKPCRGCDRGNRSRGSRGQGCEGELHLSNTGARGDELPHPWSCCSYTAPPLLQAPEPSAGQQCHLFNATRLVAATSRPAFTALTAHTSLPTHWVSLEARGCQLDPGVFGSSLLWGLLPCRWGHGPPSSLPLLFPAASAKQGDCPASFFFHRSQAEMISC